MSEETFNTFIQRLESVAAAKEARRKRAVIWQVELRDHTTEWFGLPVGFYDDYSFVEWSIAGLRMEHYINLMSQHFAACEAFHGCSFASMPFIDWHSQFAAFAAATGLETPQAYISEAL